MRWRGNYIYGTILLLKKIPLQVTDNDENFFLSIHAKEALAKGNDLPLSALKMKLKPQGTDIIQNEKQMDE